MTRAKCNRYELRIVTSSKDGSCRLLVVDTT